MSFYPSLEELLANCEDRSRVLEVKRSFLSIMSNLFMFAATVVLVLMLNLYFKDPRLRWLAIIPLGVFAEVLRKHHNDLYIFGLKNLQHIAGRLALNYSTPSIRYSDIRSVVVNQDVWGRIFNYGDLEIGTAAQDNAELTLNGVRAPIELAGLVEDFRHYNIDGGPDSELEPRYDEDPDKENQGE